MVAGVVANERVHSPATRGRDRVGAAGCADPDTGLAIGYVCNQMGATLVGDIRARELCQAIYECL